MPDVTLGRHAAPPRTVPATDRVRPVGEVPPWWRHLRARLVAPWIWIALWLVSRAWILHQYDEKYTFINSDVNYYLWWLTGDRRIQDTLVEYPQPVVWFLDALTLLGKDQNTYMLAFAGSMALLDAVFSWALWRRGTLRALLFWIAFVSAFGALIWFRYDMLPAFVVGVAALVVSRHPAVAGALVALGGGLKLWPAMLIAPLAGRSRPAITRLVAFGITGLALAGLAFLQGGWGRLVSPLTWQSDRGLQVESIPASWLMWQRATGDAATWKVEMSKYNAFEIFGPGIETWMLLSDIVMLLAIVSAIGMVVVALVRKQMPADLLALCMTSIVLAMIVANKTLSPQYLLWLGTPVAALLSLSRTPSMRRRAHLLAGATLLAGYLTHLVYPVYYGHIIGETPQMAATGMMVGRNLLLVAMMVLASLWAWDDLTAPPESEHA